MNWQTIQDSLRDMEPTGPDGFEGLVATLLSRHAGLAFVLAASGSQPGGDALDHTGTISLQAKKYDTKSGLRLNEIEGEVHAALRAVPTLDVYVPVITRDAAQLRTRLERVSIDTGLDIIVIDESDIQPNLLTALCVTYWKDILRFTEFRKLGTKGSEFAESHASEDAVKLQLQYFKSTLEHSLNSYAHLAKKSLAALNERFKQTSTRGMNALKGRINLEESYGRPSIELELEAWFKEEDAPVACLEGEEGMGKSWVAARFAETKVRSAVPVFWLGHRGWEGKESIDELFSVSLRAIGIRDDNVGKRYLRKLHTRWMRPVLFVLDDAHWVHDLSALERLIEDVQAVQPTTVRLLITTRDLRRRTEIVPSFWDTYTQIKVQPLNNDELATAISMYDPSLAISDLPDRIREIVSIPRYLKTSLRLRDRLKSFVEITKEVVHWIDLCDRLESDVQIRGALDLRSTADLSQVLSKLASKLPLTEDGACPPATRRQLNECFSGDYSGARRRALEELKFVSDSGPFEATPSTSVVLLGWALYVLERVKASTETDLDSLVDRIGVSLEPMHVQDQRTEALFVASLLSLLSPGLLGEHESEKRTALHYAWLSSPNARVTTERLDLWVETDVEGYAGFVERYYDEVAHPHTLQYYALPLARVWRDDSRSRELLTPYIDRWLQLVWTDSLDDDTTSLNTDGVELPVARSREHLGLANLAISVLSAHPDLDLLRSLAICVATMEVSTLESHGRTHHPKYLYDSIAKLFRWRYTESTVEELEKLVVAEQSAVAEGARKCASFLRLVELPKVLQSPPRKTRIEPLVGPLEVLRNSESLFPEARPRPYWFVLKLGILAARIDLPEIHEADRDYLKTEVRKLIERGEALSKMGLTEDDLVFEQFWPLLARLDHMSFADAVGALHDRAIDCSNPYRVLDFVCGCLSSKNSEQYKELFEALYIWLASRLGNKRWDLPAIKIVELAMSLATAEDLPRLLDLLSESESGCSAFATLPNPYLLGKLAPEGLIDFARERTDGLLKDAAEGVRRKHKTMLRHWLCVVESLTSEDAGIHEWAKDLLKTPSLTNDERRLAWMIFASSATSQWPQDVLNNSDSHPTIDAVGVEVLTRRSAPWPSSIDADLEYENTMSVLQHDLSARVFLTCGRYDLLDRWIQELLQAFNRWQSNFLHMEGKLSGQQTGAAGVSQNDSDSEEEDSINRWKEYSFDNFSAYLPLREWAARNPVALTKHLDQILNCQARISIHEHILRSFIDILLCIQIEVSPEQWKSACEAHRNSRLTVSFPSGVTTFHAASWRQVAAGQSEILEYCKRQLESATDDLEVLTLTLAALSEDAGDYLKQFVLDELIVSSVAKDRALAVSILPWFAEDWSQMILQSLKDTDPNLWVREHADWAYEVGCLETSCREMYRQVLAEPDPIRASAILQTLKPVLSPTAKWWQPVMICECGHAHFEDKRLDAAHYSFWWHRFHHSDSKVEVNNRDLKRYCRGEKLDSQGSKMLVPWWRLD